MPSPEEATTSQPFSMEKTSDADAILRELTDAGEANDFHINRLVNNYLLLCPEIVNDPGCSSDNSASLTKVRQMFASNSDAVYRLIRIIPYRAKKAAIEFLYATILSNVDQRLNVPFVVDCVAACVNATCIEAKCLPSPKQTAVFVEYCIVEVMKIITNSPPAKKEQLILKRLDIHASVVETVIAESEKKVDVIQHLLDLFKSQLSKLPRSAEDERKIEAIRRILSKLASIFPVFALNDAWLVNSATSPAAAEDMATHDRNLHQVILAMFLNYQKNDSSGGKACLDQVMTAAKIQPSVFVRHIPLLVSKLYTVSQFPMGVKRMKDVGYYDIFVSVLRAIIAADPESFESEMDILKVFEFYFEYFKTNITKTKSAFIELVKVLADVCLLYMERYNSSAQKYLLKKITYLIEMKKYCHEYVTLRVIINSLPNCPEKQALAVQNIRPRSHYQRDARERREYFKR
ncbi:hypothetical protein QR680_018902 [Steinernema hermaphroditum]|uniref:Integrator complex subunit 1 R3 domain-containing protein n=1 Tax=Steinernema hermaphroditum TaxID=289476 RepID=A0AA39LRT9_9BILA|nr:hypothetical protein QR680_018902 [Steinernema hermaphroditum]